MGIIVEEFLEYALQDRIIDKNTFDMLEEYLNDVLAEIKEQEEEKKERDMEAHYDRPDVIAGEVFQDRYDQWRKEY